MIVHNDGEYRQMVVLHACYCHYMFELYVDVKSKRFFPCVVIFVLIHADDNKIVNICLTLSIINICYLKYQLSTI